MSELNSDPKVSAEEIERDTAKLQQINEVTAKRYSRVRQNARAVFRAMEGWQRVGSQEDWDAISQMSHEQYRSGFFLLKRLGAERHLDPELAATIGHLRQSLLGQAGDATTAEAMLADLAVLSYYHVFRIQGWIGDLATIIEGEFFGRDVPVSRFGSKRQELLVEEHVRRFGEQLLPLLDRASRMMLRNLKALKELRQGPVPAVAIARAEQVNVAERQANAVVGS